MSGGDVCVYGFSPLFAVHIFIFMGKSVSCSRLSATIATTTLIGILAIWVGYLSVCLFGFEFDAFKVKYHLLLRIRLRIYTFPFHKDGT